MKLSDLNISKTKSPVSLLADTKERGERVVLSCSLYLSYPSPTNRLHALPHA